MWKEERKKKLRKDERVKRESIRTKTKTKKGTRDRHAFPFFVGGEGKQATNSMRVRILLGHHYTVDDSEISLLINRTTKDYTGNAALLSFGLHPIDHYFLGHPPLTFDRFGWSNYLRNQCRGREPLSMFF